MRDLESAAVAKEGYMWKEIARALAQERELWQKERENQVLAIERERGGRAHIVEASLLQEYIGILIGEIRGQGMLVP